MKEAPSSIATTKFNEIDAKYFGKRFLQFSSLPGFLGHVSKDDDVIQDHAQSNYCQTVSDNAQLFN